MRVSVLGDLRGWVATRDPTSPFVEGPRDSANYAGVWEHYAPSAFGRDQGLIFSYFDPKVVVADSCLSIAGTTMYHFGVHSSEIHMAWVHYVCGRIKSDYRYSNELVYNNFPWPEKPTAKSTSAIAAKAQAVLDARTDSGASLAEMYDPAAMPAKLRKAHGELDRAVDACYRGKSFHSDRERVEYLFGMFEKLTAPLTAGLKEPTARWRRNAK